jgi:SAM-dependent methyltransferase
MDFLISLQTHNKSNNQDNYEPYEGFKFKRYGCQDKTEIVKRCTRSLIKSINYAQQKLPNWNFKLNVFDDHSTDLAIQILKNNLSEAIFPTQLNHCEGYGLISSLRDCYLDMKNNGKDLVMQVQDDYLFSEECFYQMVLQWEKFNPKFEKPLSLLQYNDPYRYIEHNVVPVRIVQGPDRHWRQTYQVPCTFMTHHSVLVDEWDLFEKISNGNPHNPKLEDDSVNLLWQKRDYVVMSPLPSLALHFQSELEKDPYIDWESWWNKHGDESQKQKNINEIFNVDEKIVLNVGCGKTILSTQSNYFEDWKEVRVDAFENDTADIITSIVNLEKIPNDSVDCVWASHVVEHNYWHDLAMVFNSIMRVLKEDGFAIIRVPDIGSISHMIEDSLLEPLYETSGRTVSIIDMLYGHRGFVESWGDGMCHKTGFTKKSMEQILSSLNIKSFIKNSDLEIIAILCKGEPPQDIIDGRDFLSTNNSNNLSDVNKVDGWFNYYPYYKSILKDLPNKFEMVEVGSWLGKSTIGMALMNKESNKDCKIYAIDTWEGSDEEYHKDMIQKLSKQNKTLYEKFISNIEQFNLQDVVVPIKNTSEEASKQFEDNSIDIIIIDAAHDYDNVYNDIKHWLPKVKKDGILAGDDYDENWPGVIAAVNDYFGMGNFEINGTTWYKKIL